MRAAVLIVTSTRAYADPQEILRLQDTVAALIDQGRAVDVLIPRHTPLLTAALNKNARVFTVPKIPFMNNPPRRPSFRRFLTGLLMFFYAVSLTARRNYGVLHGINDGSMIVRAIDRCTVKQYPYIAEIHTPYTKRGLIHGIRRIIASRLERAALRHASAIIVPEENVISVFGQHIPVARTVILPSPRTDFSPDGFTVGEFALSIEHLYAYVLRNNDVE